MSRLERLLEQPFEEAPNRGFNLLLVGGVGLLAVVALLGRHSILEAMVVVYLLAIPAYVAVRVRTWNEELARVEPPAGREESSVVGLEDEQGDGADGAGDGDDEGSG